MERLHSLESERPIFEYPTLLLANSVVLETLASSSEIGIIDFFHRIQSKGNEVMNVKLITKLNI